MAHTNQKLLQTIDTLHAQHSQTRTCIGLAYDGHKADTSETLPVMVVDTASYMINAAGHGPNQQKRRSITYDVTTRAVTPQAGQCMRNA